MMTVAKMELADKDPKSPHGMETSLQFSNGDYLYRLDFNPRGTPYEYQPYTWGKCSRMLVETAWNILYL